MTAGTTVPRSTPAGSGSGGELVFEEVTVAYPGSTTPMVAVSDFSLECAATTFTAMVGGNGCGKTSLIRAACGLLQPAAGRIVHEDVVVTEPDPRRWLIQQRSNLLPWLTVEANLEFARSCARSESGLSIPEALRLVGLPGAAGLRPGQLSGGMVQRAELARALVVGPDLLLLDEPFGAVDALSRLTLQRELRRVVGQWNATCLMVTHDIAEAVYLADQVVVLGGRPGRVLGVMSTAHPSLSAAEWQSSQRFRDTCKEIEELLAQDERSRAGVTGPEEPAAAPRASRRWWPGRSR